MANIETLIHEGAKLKAEIDALQIQYKEINQQIFEQTTFANGKNTATTQAGNIIAKIQRKETYTFDQEKLDAVRQFLGDTKFMELFTFKWQTLKKNLDGFLAHAPAEQKKPVMDALTIKPSFSVTYEVTDV